MVQRDRLDSTNFFQWVSVKLNMLNTDGYDPSHYWIYKDRMDGSVAAYTCWYIDNRRPTTFTVWEYMWVSCKFVFTLYYYGLKNNNRKRIETNKQLGEWVRIIMNTTGDMTIVFDSTKK